ncbi:MAG: hypothetical protein J6S23_00700 [Clostridia bacterium]|nr:hypothetical protein [Clostridia bacterium]
MNLKTYREKKNEIHTTEEIKEAFDTSFAMCFEIDRGSVKSVHTKSKLFTDIWTANPDAIITEADLCVMSTEPSVMRDQFFLINKNGTKDTTNEIVKLIEESGIISSAYCFFSEKRAGIKGCYRRVFGDDKPSIIKKGNLLVDGDKLLVTVRTQTKTDREKLKEERKACE